MLVRVFFKFVDSEKERIDNFAAMKLQVSLEGGIR
jgi:hypothetical protein